jgi:hypothetical protein
MSGSYRFLLYFMGPETFLGTTGCFLSVYFPFCIGTATLMWLRCCATNRKVAGSIPDGVIEFFIDINPSDRTMALRSTHPLTEMSTRSISWG